MRPPGRFPANTHRLPLLPRPLRQIRRRQHPCDYDKLTLEIWTDSRISPDEALAPAMANRAGGYTRIVKLGQRISDSSEMCILEWVDFVPKAKKAKSEKPAKDEKKAE